jgi:hypothetical protein
VRRTGGAVAHGELAEQAERRAGGERGGGDADRGRGQLGAQRVEEDRLAGARRRHDQAGTARVDGEAEAFEGFVEARVMEQALGRHGTVEGQGGEAEVVQEFVDGGHRGASFRVSACCALRWKTLR